MAVTGVFQADFASFYDAVQKADVQLRTFDSGAAKVEATLSRMSDTFSGRRIISEATAMAEVFERSGGAARFTEAELSRMGATGAEAVAKMKAIGVEVPANLQRMTTAAEGARVPVQGLTTTYRQFDGVLAAMGINIGPQVKGLEDIAAASGKTASSVGLLGTAGLALGAGFAGWGLGRMVMEFFELDGAVEKAWRQLLNYGDVAAQTAGAKQDTINRAIANGAAATISYTDAIKFNVDAMQRTIDKNIDWTGKLAAAQREVRGLSEATIREIEIADKAGATTEQLTNKYGVSALALKVLAENQKLAADATEQHRKAQEALIKNFDDARSGAMKKMHAQEAADMEAAMQRRIANEEGVRRMESEAHQAGLAELEARTAAEAQAEVARIAANQAEIDGILQASAAHTEGAAIAKGASDQVVAGYQGVAQQITITGDAVREWINLMRYTAQANAILSENSLFTTTSQRQRIAALGFPSAPNLSANAPLGGGGGATFNNTFQIVDTESNIAHRVSQNIMQQVRSGTQLTQ